MSSSEPFPLLSTSADQQRSVNEQNMARRRRKSSLPAEIRAGDTGVPSLQTSLENLQQTNSNKKRRKARSALRRFKHVIIKHTWLLPLLILFVFGAAYAVNPTESNPVHRFIFLSYKLPLEPGAAPDTPAHYGKGKWDIAFFSFYTVVLSFTREFIMQELLRPLARAAGLKSRGKQSRFMEQAYTAIYFAFLGPAGLYVMKQTPIWYFNTRAFYENFPHKTHTAGFKFYYLFQAAYWAQQAIVLLIGLEKPRKDYKELVGHHIVSLALIALSYRFHFTYIGIAVYITHDISDFFLATSKVLNYMDHWLVGPYFFVFMCAWTYLRHYLNLRFIYSLFTEFRTVGPYELNWETEQYKCDISFVITFALLASLQALNLFWMFFIVRIAYRFVVYQTADDDRSEAEESELEEIEAKKLTNGYTTGAIGPANDAVRARPNGTAATKKK
ncbi:TLC domain-containing protein [Xylariaceae sp. FL0255]|nr:TLC domain-containing protein [Xylariaceae sp. FL0255]